MPEIKLDSERAKKLLRETGDPVLVAEAMDVHSSTIYRFIDREEIQMKWLRTVKDQGIRRVALALSDIGIDRSTMARWLAVSPAYITKILGPTQTENQTPQNHVSIL